MYHIDDDHEMVREFVYKRSNLILMKLRLCEKGARIKIAGSGGLEIVFAFWDENTAFSIKQELDDIVVHKVVSVNGIAALLLSCTAEIPMWISWNDGHLRIGNGDQYGNDSVILEALDHTGMAKYVSRLKLRSVSGASFTVNFTNSKYGYAVW